MKKCIRDQENINKSEDKIETAKSGPAACQQESNYRNHLNYLEAKNKSTINSQITRLQRKLFKIKKLYKSQIWNKGYLFFN